MKNTIKLEVLRHILNRNVRVSHTEFLLFMTASRVDNINIGAKGPVLKRENDHKNGRERERVKYRVYIYDLR